MIKKLYLVRHSQTVFNERKKIQGWCDAPLTELGKYQGEVAKTYFQKSHITFDDAYCSTSERTSDTLELITDTPYTRVKGLKEWHFGLFEGESESLNPPLPYGDFFASYGGEAERDFKKRITTTIHSLMSKTKGSHILMVSHGAACAQFARAWAHNSQIGTVTGLKNCCVLTFDFDTVEETFTLVDFTQHDFSGFDTKNKD